jgi:predicted enzyme related to lactoylglutathione lyase
MAELLVNVDVDDLEKGVTFYTEAFGLTLARRFGADGAEMLGGPTPIYLLFKPAGSVAAPRTAERRGYGRHWTPVHLDFVVEDIAAAVARAQAAGAKLEAPVKSSNWGKLARMADPFGHGFCLIEFVGRGYAEISTAAGR